MYSGNMFSLAGIVGSAKMRFGVLVLPVRVSASSSRPYKLINSEKAPFSSKDDVCSGLPQTLGPKPLNP